MKDLRRAARVLMLVATGVVAAAAFAGCGSGEGGEPTTVITPISAEQLTAIAELPRGTPVPVDVDEPLTEYEAADGRYRIAHPESWLVEDSNPDRVSFVPNPEIVPFIGLPPVHYAIMCFPVEQAGLEERADLDAQLVAQYASGFLTRDAVEVGGLEGIRVEHFLPLGAEDLRNHNIGVYVEHGGCVYRLLFSFLETPVHTTDATPLFERILETWTWPEEAS